MLTESPQKDVSEKISVSTIGRPFTRPFEPESDIPVLTKSYKLADKPYEKELFQQCESFLFASDLRFLKRKQSIQKKHRKNLSHHIRNGKSNMPTSVKIALFFISHLMKSKEISDLNNY